MPSHNVRSSSNGGVHLYLIDSARDALKRGDKSAAKSCLLTARYLSINDSDVTYEIYQMAKSDGDVVEASKCFTNIFLDQTPLISRPSKSKKLISEETRLMINELLHRHLKIKSVLHPPPASIKGSSLSTSSIAGKRRSSSDTPVVHDQETEEQFYFQLYETLNQDIQKAVLTQTIKDCESKLEQCRLMLLFLILFPNEESSEKHGSKLLETLIEMSQKPDISQEASLQTLMSIYYSRGLLISDAVPLILKSVQPDKIKSLRDDILLRTFSFYIEFCLSSASSENNCSKMLDGHHDQLSKQSSSTNNDKPTEKEYKVEVQFRSALHLIAKLMEWELICDSSIDTSEKRMDYAQRWSQISDFISRTIIDSSENSTEIQQQSTKHRGRLKKTAAAIANDGSVNPEEQSNNLKQLFYSLVELMFTSITQYLRSTRNYILTRGYTIDNMGAPTIPLDKASANIEDRQPNTKKIKSEPVEEPDDTFLNKTFKGEVMDINFYQLDHSIVRSTDVQMKSSFLTAVKCYEKLTSIKKLKKLWEPFHDALGLKVYYGWQGRFQVDYHIYSALYQQAMDYIQVDCKEINPYMGTNDSEAIKLRSSIQLTCCVFMLEDKTKTLDYCYNLVKDIKTFHILTTELNQSYNFHSSTVNDDLHLSGEPALHIDTSARNLVYLSFSSQSFLSYCIDIICQALKQQTFFLTKPPDLGTGHLIVLSQYEWPKKCELFRRCVNLIRKHKPKTATPQSISPTTKFTYHSFFSYVYNPCIIEEFMALLQQGYTLDIKSTGHIQTGLSEQSQSQSFSSSGLSTTRQQTSPISAAQGGSTSTKAITTRGVNKSFKEDMKSALVCQMKKSTVTPNVILFIDFILEEVLPYLKDRSSANQFRHNTKSSRRS